MGNFASCTMAGAAGSGARVVPPDGRVRHVELPMTCAELMLEAPGHFLVETCALGPGRRIEALAADEDLQRGILYAALPMKCLSAPMAAADVAGLAAAVVSRGEKVRRRMRMRPASSPAATVKVSAVIAPHKVLEAATAASVEQDAPKPRAPIKLDEMAVDDAAAAAEIEDLRQRLSSGDRRSRRPTLKTIQEESYALPARC